MWNLISKEKVIQKKFWYAIPGKYFYVSLLK